MDDPQVIDAFLDEGSAPVDDVAAALADCRMKSRAFGEIDPAGCASLLPTLVLVDTPGAAGVDATVDVTAPVEAWVRMVQDLLR